MEFIKRLSKPKILDTLQRANINVELYKDLSTMELKEKILSLELWKGIFVKAGLLIKSKPVEPVEPVEPTNTIEFDNPDYNELKQKIENAKTQNSNGGIKTPVIEKTQRRKRRNESDPNSFKVEGYILLMVVDTFFPFALSFVNNLFDKTIQVKANELMLTDKQMSKLEPIADQCADYLSVNISPVWGFVILTSISYTNNLITLRMNKSEIISKNEKTT